MVQFRSLRDEMSQRTHYRVKVFGISTDSHARNKRFAARLMLEFPLLSDPDKDYARALSVLNPSGVALRWTYVIDENGVIREIDKKVKPEGYGRHLAARLEALGIPRR